MTYYYKHPQGQWKEVTAECDARNFAILNDWPISTRPYDSEFQLKIFTIAKNEKTGQFFELLDVLEFEQFEVEGKQFEDRAAICKDSENRETVVRRRDLVALETEVFRVCEASDPAGMKQPLELIGKYKAWFIPVPKEVFGMDRCYVRIIT